MVSVTPTPTTLVSVDEARRTLLGLVSPLAAEDVALDEALGRVLAEDVVAATDLPGIDNSAMDGYAVASRDLSRARSDAPVILALGAESRAGHPPPTHQPRTATVITTGAPVPSGADAVVPVEDTLRTGRRVQIRTAPVTGAYVRRRGHDVRQGTVVASAGTRLRSVDIGVCAAAGRAQVSVAVRPRVALLSSGDELVPPGSTPLPHQVTDVNSSMLAAAVREAGGCVTHTDVIADDRSAVTSALLRAGERADLIVSSAGVSMGGHDHLRECVAALGAVDVWKVAMRPGKPVVIGRVGRTPYIGLPGNPVSSAVTFLLFARAAILAMQGAKAVLPPVFPAILGDSFHTPAHLEAYVRVRLRRDGENLVATSSGGQGSDMMHALSGADALALIPAGLGEAMVGTPVGVMILP